MSGSECSSSGIIFIGQSVNDPNLPAYNPRCNEYTLAGIGPPIQGRRQCPNTQYLSLCSEPGINLNTNINQNLPTPTIPDPNPHFPARHQRHTPHQVCHECHIHTYNHYNTQSSLQTQNTLLNSTQSLYCRTCQVQKLRSLSPTRTPSDITPQDSTCTCTDRLQFHPWTQSCHGCFLQRWKDCFERNARERSRERYLRWRKRVGVLEHDARADFESPPRSLRHVVAREKEGCAGCGKSVDYYRRNPRRVRVRQCRGCLGLRVYGP